MRVLYFGTYDRGVGRNAILQEGLAAVGAHVSECHTPLWPDTAAKLGAARSPGRAWRQAYRQGVAWMRLVAAYRRLRHWDAGDYDVLFVGPTAHLDLPVARMLATRTRRPLVFDPLVSAAETVRDRQLLDESAAALRWLDRVERRLFSLPDLVLTDTGAHAAAWSAELGLDPRKSAVLPAGAPSVYRRLASPYAAGRAFTAAQPFRVVYFGQFIPLHGLETVLAAAARLLDRPEIAFHLVGTGQTQPAIQRLAAELRLPNVHFHATWLSAEDLTAGHLAPADLCLGIFGTQPKADRVVPYKVYAAMAAGRPVLTADTAAVRELLNPGEEVWTVPPGDPDALAQAVRELADRPDLRSRLAAAGQAAYDARFAPPVLGRRLVELLRPLVVESRGGLR